MKLDSRSRRCCALDPAQASVDAGADADAGFDAGAYPAFPSAAAAPPVLAVVTVFDAGAVNCPNSTCGRSWVLRTTR